MLKKYLLITASLFFVCFAFSEQKADRTESSDVAPNDIVLQKVMFGGEVPPELHGWEEQITVFGSGIVIRSYKANYLSPWEDVEVAFLPPHIMSDLINLTHQFMPAELIQPEPLCYDLPTSQYFINVAPGELGMFAIEEHCNLSISPGFGAAPSLMTVLDGFQSLVDFH